YGRYGYRKVAALLRQAGWTINDKRVERIWQREGLKVPHKQPKRGRLWLADGSCIRLRPQQRNHVWSYDFVEDRTHEGRKYRMLNVLDEFPHECLAIRVARKLKAIDVIDVLSDLFILQGIPAYIRSDNGPEFLAKAVQEWIAVVGAKTAYIERGSPWENGYIESFNARLRDTQRRDFLHFTRGPDRHRELATPLQHDQAPRLNRIQATSTRGVRARIRRVAGCATLKAARPHEVPLFTTPDILNSGLYWAATDAGKKPPAAMTRMAANLTMTARPRCSLSVSPIGRLGSGCRATRSILLTTR